MGSVNVAEDDAMARAGGRMVAMERRTPNIMNANSWRRWVIVVFLLLLNFAVRGVFFISMMTVFVSIVPLPYSAMNWFDTTRDKSMNSWRCRCRCPSLILCSRPNYLPSCSVFVAVMVLYCWCDSCVGPAKILTRSGAFLLSAFCNARRNQYFWTGCILCVRKKNEWRQWWSGKRQKHLHVESQGTWPWWAFNQWVSAS